MSVVNLPGVGEYMSRSEDFNELLYRIEWAFDMLRNDLFSPRGSWHRVCP